MQLRRCIHCSASHCCNSWCKEELLLLQLSVVHALVQFFPYFPVLDSLSTRLGFDFVLPIYVDFLAKPEVSRALEALGGSFCFPLLAFLWLPAYRKFGRGADGDDLRMVERARKRRRRFV